MRELFEAAMRQTHLPTRIFILQNRMHVLLNFTSIYAATGNMSVLHVWCTNWNSFFFLTYVLVRFVPERFVIKVDDDNIPIDRTGFANYLNVAIREDTIIGRLGWVIDSSWCGVSPRIGPSSNYSDHVAALVLFDSRACKIMHRFRWHTYLSAEDVAIGVSNALECGTTSRVIPFEIGDYGYDGRNHGADPEISRELAKQSDWAFMLQYCHAIFGGFRPNRWRDFQVPTPIDIRLPH
jgi:hypothetical protein